MKLRGDTKILSLLLATVEIIKGAAMRKAVLNILLAAVSGSAMVGCLDADNKDAQVMYVYTLYRNVPSDSAFRVHVATFDSKAFSGGKELDEAMNKKNCERVQSMFQSQSDWSNLHFWCEKGRFKK